MRRILLFLKLSGRWKCETHTLRNSICHSEEARSVLGVCVWQSCVNKAMWEYACRETWGKTERNRWTNRGGDGEAARPYEGACKWEPTAVKSAGIERGVLRAGLKWERDVCVIPLFQRVMFALLAHSAPCLIPLATDTPWEEGLLFPIFSCV